MRFVTLNTWGTRGDWRTRAPILRERFRELAPDIVTLQETVLSPEEDQASEIFGPEYHVAQQSEREHGRAGAPPGQGITTVSRWPFGRVCEVDINVTDRTGDFACTCLVTEVCAPPPFGRIWVANHFPDYQLDHERERRLQALAVARALESLVAEVPGHVIVAGDMDAEPNSDSLRFWTGRHVIDDTSVCYRSAWEAVHAADRLVTYEPANPHQVTPDWPFTGIDHVLVRCAAAGPTLLATECSRVFDVDADTISDHYGLVVDYVPAPALA